jgi:hypothetical protein
LVGQARDSRRWIVHATVRFVFLIGGEEKSCDWADTWGTQVAETPDKDTQGDKQPEAAQQRPSSRMPAIVVSLSALAVIGAATANSLPDFTSFSLPNFDFSLPDFNRFAAQPHVPHKTASTPIPDPAVSATLADIQLSQQQNAAVLVSLTQSIAIQQVDLERISRQLSSLAAQADALLSAMTPLTTSSISHSNTRARVVRTSRKIASPPPRPFGPVSVGGAPLSPAPGSGAG